MGMLLSIQSAIAKRLMDSPYMAGIDVLTQDDGDLDTMIRAKLALLGIAATVGLGKAGDPMPNAGGPYFEDVVFVVEVQEFVLKNRSAAGSRKSAVDVCEHIAHRLHGWEFAPGKALMCVDPGIIPVPSTPPATAAYAVAIQTSDGVDATPQTEGHTA